MEMTLPPPPTPAQLDDREWCEAQYNPRLTVPDPAAILARWAGWAVETRRRLPFRTIAYGAHPREALDFFAAPAPKGLLIYIHGGYWRAQHKDDFSWIADAFVAAGYSVAIFTYPHCPETTVSAITENCRQAVMRLLGEVSPAERANVVLTGHSAGGYLTAALFATDWAAMGQPAAPFRAGVSFSGVFELAPLLNTSMNELIRLTPNEARDWSLDTARPTSGTPLTLAYGGAEPLEFHRQSLAQAARWRDVCGAAVEAKSCNHFSIIEQLREPGSQMFRLAMAALERSG